MVPMNNMNHHLGSGLSYSSMPSKEWPTVSSVVSARWPLRVASSSQVRQKIVPNDSTVTYRLQNVLILCGSWRLSLARGA